MKKLYWVNQIFILPTGTGYNWLDLDWYARRCCLLHHHISSKERVWASKTLKQQVHPWSTASEQIYSFYFTKPW